MITCETMNNEKFIKLRLKEDDGYSVNVMTQYDSLEKFINFYLNSKPGNWTLISVTSEQTNNVTLFHFFWAHPE